MSKTEYEIMHKFAALITPKEALDNPEEYLAKEHYKNPNLEKLTHLVLSSVIKHHPALFFHYHLDEDSRFNRERQGAALSLIEKDPLAALFVYKFHRKEEYDFVWVPLLHELLKSIKNVEEARENNRLMNEISVLVGAIGKHYPEFGLTVRDLPRTESGESIYTGPRSESGEGKYNQGG